MRIRCWKIGALAAGLLTASASCPSLLGQEAAPKAEAASAAKPKAEGESAAKPKAEGESAAKPKAKAGPGRKVVLRVAVPSGTGGEGCTIEVKPANATCRFTPRIIEVPAGSGSGRAVEEDVTLDDVELRGADRNLSIAITIREAGGAMKTVYRGYRVAAAPKPGQAERFTCWMTPPSRTAVIAAPEPAPTRR